MPVITTYKACTTCGALVGASSSEGGGGDNSRSHQEWHARQDRLLKAHDDMLKALAHVVAPESEDGEP